MELNPAKTVLKIFCTLFFAAAVLPAGTCMASSPGNFLAQFPKESDGIQSFMAMQAEQQINNFARQRERRPEIDRQGEERHYSEIRSSENTFAFDGIKTGVAFGRVPLIYVLAGYGRADVDFSFTDELTENKYSYSTQTRFENDGFPVFGGGISAMMHDTSVLENSRFSVGADLQYRWLDFEAEEGALFYKSTLHEIQLAIAAGLENLKWRPGGGVTLGLSPYGGAKISHFFGDETFSDPANRDLQGNPDPIHYEGDINPGNHISFFIGTNIDLTQSLFLGMETRFGDDDGYAVQLGYKF